MTVAELEFDPFSEDFFNGPYETYRRMREEAPVYYSERYDFYALSRHVDVAAAYKNFETYSSARGVDLAAVRSEEPMGHKSIIMMDRPSTGTCAAWSTRCSRRARSKRCARW